MKARWEILILTVLALFCSTTRTVSISLDQRFHDYCFKVFVPEGHNLTTSYVITGRNEMQAEYTVSRKINDMESRLFTERAKGRGKFSQIAETEGNYSLCVKRLDRHAKLANVAFQVIEPKQKNTTQVDPNVDEGKYCLDKISHNVKMLTSRGHIHTKLSLSNSSSIIYCNIAKIIVILIICVAQIYFVTSFFNKRAKSKVPPMPTVHQGI